MRFEFKPKDFKKDFIEFQRQLLVDTNAAKCFKKCCILPIFIALVLYIESITGVGFWLYSGNLNIVFMYYIALIALIFLVGIVSNKIRGSVLSKLHDFDETVSFTFEDKAVIRENESSTIKVSYDNISKINISKKGISIFTKNSITQFFIPKKALTVTMDEFIAAFENYDIKIKKRNKSFIKDFIKIAVILFLVVAFGVARSYYIMHYLIVF